MRLELARSPLTRQELSDQIVRVESPLYNGRALAAVAAANKLVPGKTVSTVINSHHHFDHAGGLRTAEVHELQGSVHAQGFTMVWLPAERMLIQADAYTPAAPNSPVPAVPNANHVNLVQNLERLNLQPERLLPLHSGMVPDAELLAQIGRRRPAVRQ